MSFLIGAPMFRQGLPVLLFLSSQLLLNPAQAVNGDTRPAELATANDKLNKVYKSLMTQLEQKDREKLKNAQRIWITLRDVDCKWASPAEPLDCMIDRTDRRTDELRTSMFRASNGKYTSLELQ
jgi:uncharacterized protein YecT (DUF1311 family)